MIQTTQPKIVLKLRVTNVRDLFMGVAKLTSVERKSSVCLQSASNQSRIIAK